MIIHYGTVQWKSADDGGRNNIPIGPTYGGVTYINDNAYSIFINLFPLEDGLNKFEFVTEPPAVPNELTLFEGHKNVGTIYVQR